MALRQRLADWLAPPEQREDASWANLTTHGQQANARMAESLSAVFACVNVISSALSQLPPRLYRTEGGERREIESGATHSRINDPNHWQTWPDLIEWLMGEVLLYGNAILVLDEGKLLPIRGHSIIPVRWQSSSVLQKASGRLQYDVAFGQGEYLINRAVSDDQVLHLRDRSDDGMIGVSRLRRCGAVLELGQDLQDAAIALWRHGAFPSGVLSLAGKLSSEQRERLRQDLTQNFSGASNRARALLLDGGATWQRMDSTPRDTEVLESRKFMTEEIARIFEVPPPLIQDYRYNTFTNAATAGQWFARFTLGAWVRKVERLFAKMLPNNVELELDMSAYLRSDHGERWNSYDIALRNDVLTPEDVQQMEGW